MMQESDPGEYQNLLEACRNNIGKVPRSISLWQWLTYHCIAMPLWAWNDDLQPFFSRQFYLMKSGRVVWGHLVQANGRLFQSGTNDAPGEIVYCVDYKRPVHLLELSHIASRCYKLKHGERRNEQEHFVGNHLENEYTRVFGLDIPATISRNLPCTLSTVQICRHHLPNGRLTKTWFSLFMDEEPPYSVMILPSRYWPQALINNWQA